MSKLIKSIILAGVLSFVSLPITSNAYHCGWHNGHRVCWSEGQRYCKWVGGHWHHGVYYPAHKVCWYRR